MTRATWNITCADSDWVTDSGNSDSYTARHILGDEVDYEKKALKYKNPFLLIQVVFMNTSSFSQNILICIKINTINATDFATDYIYNVYFYLIGYWW